MSDFCPHFNKHRDPKDCVASFEDLVDVLREMLSRAESGPDLVAERDAAVAALREIVRRHFRGCGVRYAGRDKGWTCLDEQQKAIESPGVYSEPFGSEVREGKRLCDVCVARAALVRLGEPGGLSVSEEQPNQ